MATTIEWTDDTWNPVTGCSKVSPGCAHCYAETVALRFWPTQYPRVESASRKDVPEGVFVHPSEPRAFTDVRTHEDRLDQPLRWRRPRKVFVNSMSDLFHEDVPDFFIARVFSVMAWARQHTFQVLTKRAERMRRLVSSPEFRAEVAEFIEFLLHDDPVDVAALRWDPLNRRKDDARAQQPDIEGDEWPLRNVWLGVSVENQHFANERIPLLLQTPASVRFLSLEPLLEQVDLTNYLWTIPGARLNCLHWLIVGGESGPGARPFDIAWVRWTVAQGRSSGVPVFVKQLGAFPIVHPGDEYRDTRLWASRVGLASDRRAPEDFREPWPFRVQLRDRKGGDVDEWPEDLRVREFPETR